MSRAQEEAPKILQITKANELITIDGMDQESSWTKTGLANQFINKWPLDTGLAKLQTEVRLLYDDKYLYVFAIMHVQIRTFIQSLKRDIAAITVKGFPIAPPSGQKASGFTF
jgi:hypothetical protein